MRRPGLWQRGTALAVCAALVGFFFEESAQAHAPDTYGFGSRASAMASAAAADATDFSAGYYNPAGLVGAPGLSLSLGYSYAA